MRSARGASATVAGLAVLVALAGGGCLVSSLEEETRLVLSVGLGGDAIARHDFPATSTPWDSSGLFQLRLFPKLVRVAVEAQDTGGSSFELESGTWPTVERGVGEGEGPAGEVAIELRVPAGTGRLLRGLGFLVQGGQVQVFREEAAPSLDLVAGKTTEVTLAMKRQDTGTAAATARCESGNQGVWVPHAISLVDARALVIHPPRLLGAGPTVGTLLVEIAGVPVGRHHWARTYLRQRETGEEKFIDLRQLTFVVSSAHEQVPVNLVLPCEL